MKKFAWLLMICLLLTLAGCGKTENKSAEVIETELVAPRGKLEGCSLMIRPVDDLPENFIFGMDASQVPSLERSGVQYYDFNGQEQDVFRILAENGVNYIRVRIWNDPYDAEGHGYGGGNCDVDNALEIGRRATRYGMPLLVDFHYSDFWADPGKQSAPKAWAGLSVDEKSEKLYQFTKQSLEKLRDAGISVGMVQVGNETDAFLCGERAWPDITKLMAAGSRAVREVCPEALVAVHFANPENGAYPDYARALRDADLDYDVFGSSYYPYWHGSLENLTETLRKIRLSFGKQVMVMETSYAWTAEDSDFSGNTISDTSTVEKPYPYTLQGQVNNLRDVTEAVVKAGGIGVCYWEGTWISVGGASRAENQKLWEEYGSGWASSYAAEYDPDDAGKWYGGCAVDNQAFFDAKGKPLESLMAFNLIRWGNITENRVEAIETPDLACDLGGSFTLPETVTAVMTDGSRSQVPASWQTDDAALQQLAETAGVHTLRGTAEGLEFTATLTVKPRNLLRNPGFEDGVEAPWELINLGTASDVRIEKKTGDSLTGDWHWHFWSPDADSVEFRLEQAMGEIGEGSYDFSVSVMGGDCGAAEIYAYAALDGEIVATAPMEVTVWDEWHTGEITEIRCEDGQSLTVGIYVRAPQAGAWGKIDDAALSRR